VNNLDFRQLSALDGPVLITGHTGFKGMWLSLLLEELGLQTIGISKKPLKNSLYELAKQKGRIPEIYADISGPKNVKKFIRKHKPQVVFHLAAQALVLESYKDPVETFRTNVMGTVNLLDICFSEASVKSIVISTTDKVYKNLNTGKLFVESDALGGKDPYSASKVGTEAVISAWQQIREVDDGPLITAARAGNVIGGGDLAENRLMPDIARGLIDGAEIRIRNSSATRPWQHVLDPLTGYAMVADGHLAGKKIDSINFGPTEKSISVKEVCDLVLSNSETKLDFKFDEVQSQKRPQQESLFLDLDSTKAQVELGWQPTWSQKDAILETMDWWKRVLINGADPREACLKDIRKMLA
jgi:CDP-glucose 4,6-dehydratase